MAVVRQFSICSLESGALEAEPDMHMLMQVIGRGNVLEEARGSRMGRGGRQAELCVWLDQPQRDATAGWGAQAAA